LNRSVLLLWKMIEVRYWNLKSDKLMLSNQLIKYMYKGISVLQLPTCITVWPCISTSTATRRTYTRDMITWLIDTITYFGTIILNSNIWPLSFFRGVIRICSNLLASIGVMLVTLWCIQNVFYEHILRISPYNLVSIYHANSNKDI
jgi:hypothetical protein